MSSGGGTTVQKTEQKSDPWGPAQPALMDILSNAKSTYDAAQGQTQMPDSVAPLSQTTQDAYAGIANRAQNGSPLIAQAGHTLNNLMQPQTAPGSEALRSLLDMHSAPNQAASFFSDPNNINPWLNQQYQSVSAPVIDSINAQFSKAGRTGSGANQQELARNLGDLATNIFSTGYDNAANRSLSAGNQLSQNLFNAGGALNNQFNTQNGMALNAAQLSPQLANMDYADLANLLSVGQGQDAQAQNILNQGLQQWQYGQQQPWNILNAYSGAVTGMGALGGTSSGTTTSKQPGQSMLPSLLGLGASIGMAPMTGGTSLFGNMFSDARLKRDINRIGTTPNGLNLYSYKFKGSDVPFVGLMAQEVQRIKPEAVKTTPDGWLTVNYQMALAA